jgi:conjugative transfer signal peptidase TraF
MVAMLAFHQLRIVMNITPSMPIGFYHTSPLGASVDRGEIVQACPPLSIVRFALDRGYIPKGSCSTGAAPMLKIVVAAAGDRVDVSRDGVRINGALLPNSRRSLTDGRKRPLPAIAEGTYRLGPHEIWLWTPYPGSWDSRYYGPLALDDLVARAQLVLALEAWPYTKF